MTKQEIINKLKPMISSDRFIHTMSTEKTAIELAQHYGVSTNKASTAAILHDCAKNVSKDPKAFCEKYGISDKLDLYSDYPLCVLHAPLGAELAHKEFGINDEEILSAISWHTSGKANMSMLDKIIYLADYTEKTRPDTKEILEVRELCKKDLDKAMLKALTYSIEKIKSKGFVVYENTLEAYNYLSERIGE